MTDDIVTRLRTALDEMGICCLGCSIIDLNDHDHDCLTKNAADEIERLRGLLYRWENCEEVIDALCGWDSENTLCEPCKEQQS